ncbi:MAG: FAD-dependent oxidoreductase, partial [Halobacteriota archaeon]|nr:FAD-dependent oxidoreductase [Halobacteriota archaeon]
MSKGKVVIIGGGAAGIPIASNIRSKDKDREICIISKDTHCSYSPCAIPFVLEGVIKSFDDMVMHTPEYYKKERNIDVRLNTKVTSIDTDNKKVFIGSEEIEYEDLVIATGGVCFTPPIEGKDLKGVYRIMHIGDGMIVKEAMDAGAKEVVVIGAGAIGMESTIAFAEAGLKTTLVEALPCLLPLILDNDLSEVVTKKLVDMGVNVITGKSATSINGADKVESVTVGDENIPADFVIMCVGVRPNSKLAVESGIEVGGRGGIVTDAALHVKKGRGYLPDVYAVGDCTEVVCGITHRPTGSPLGTTAVRQAKVAARNICGENATFPPVLSPNICCVGDLHCGQVGVTSHAARIGGIEPVIGKSRALTRARYYPDGKVIDIKLLFGGEKLIGAQIISKEGVKERIDSLSFAIKLGMTVDEL